jgi:hypothetical protein
MVRFMRSTCPLVRGWLGFGEPVFDSMKVTEPVEGMAPEACDWPLAVLRQVGELGSVVGEHGVDAVRNGLDERLGEGSSGPHIRLFDKLDHDELRRSIDGHEQVEFAFGGSHLSQVDVEEADR